jgi:hypothetical protein
VVAFKLDIGYIRVRITAYQGLGAKTIIIEDGTQPEKEA